VIDFLDRHLANSVRCREQRNPAHEDVTRSGWQAGDAACAGMERRPSP
jgi:hypothetical protein